MTTSPTAPDNNRTARRSRNWLVFLLAIFILNRLEWPFTIRLNDWRLNEFFGSVIIILLSIAIIWFGSTRIRRVFRLTVVCVGIWLLIPMVFGFMTLDLPLLFTKPNKYDFGILDSVSAGSDEYRLYSSDFGGFGSVPYALLRKERDTPFGIKFVKTIWTSTYDCCALKLQTINESHIEVLEKTNGKVVAAIDK